MVANVFAIRRAGSFQTDKVQVDSWVKELLSVTIPIACIKIFYLCLYILSRLCGSIGLGLFASVCQLPTERIKS